MAAPLALPAGRRRSPAFLLPESKGWQHVCAAASPAVPAPANPLHCTRPAQCCHPAGCPHEHMAAHTCLPTALQMRMDGSDGHNDLRMTAPDCMGAFYRHSTRADGSVLCLGEQAAG